MYKPEGFLKFASEFLAAKISEETLTEVHDVSIENKRDALYLSEIHDRESKVLKCVFTWVETKHQLVYINEEEFPDILGVDRNEVHGYEIEMFRGRRVVSYHEIITLATRAIKTWQLKTLTIVFIVETPGELKMLRKSLARVSKNDVSDDLFVCIARVRSYGGLSLQPLAEFNFNNQSE